MKELWYRQPAEQWEEALPLGSGRLGAMVYGGVEKEHLQVNEESMWYGGAVNRHNPDTKEHLSQIRDLLEKGEMQKAERLMELSMSGCPDSMHAYQTLGDILFFFDGIENAPTRKSGKIGKMTLPQATNSYKRRLNLEEAICTTEFENGGTFFHREYFASHPADCIVMRFTANGEKTLNFYARLRREKAFDGVKKVGNNGILLYGNLGRGGYEFAMELKAEAIGGQVKTIGENLCVENAKEVVLYFTADTTYHYSGVEKDDWLRVYLDAEENKKLPEGLTEEMSEQEQREYFYQAALQAFLEEKLREKLDRVMTKSYEQLKQDHIADYQRLYSKAMLRLDGTLEEEALPTDIRLQRVAEGKADVGLDNLLFDFGRYLTIACSRKGGLPSNLQGIWNASLTPPWDSKYTININTEMNYWHVESCNLSECHEPLFALLKKVQKNGRYTARQMYGARGFVAHHNTDIHGDTAPQDIWYPGSYWTMGGAWLSTHLWTHYEYTQDRGFLEEAFPIMAEAALFFVDFLVEKDGYLVTNPSVSPENSYRLPNGQVSACCIGATMDNQILKHLFSDCRKAWKALGQKAPEGCVIPDVDNIGELMEQIAVCESKLMPTRISERGTILEWMEDYEEVEPGHRHISHLYGLHPAGQITVDGTPELAQAARKTLEHRLANGGGHTGWSRAWIMNHYARLWDGEKTYENIQKMLGLSTYPNLFDKHPPFQIDGNFGACAAISSMLVQSNEERVILLPALPTAWMSGEVKGLRLVGNAEISIVWEKGQLKKAVIHAESDYETTVCCGQEKKKLILKAGETREI